MPASVIRDKELSFAARVVFAELALWTGPGRNSVTRGQRVIAQAIGAHVETVNRALHELEEHRHIEIQGAGQSRRRYKLLSPVYWLHGDSAGEEIAMVYDGTAVQKRLVRERAS